MYILALQFDMSSDVLVCLGFIFTDIFYSVFIFVINIQPFENLEIMEVEIASQNGQI